MAEKNEKEIKVKKFTKGAGHFKLFYEEKQLGCHRAE